MNKKRLGGSCFIHNAISQDYCLKETIECLKELCDEVAVLEVGSKDGTADYVRKFEDSKTKVVCLPYEEWEKQRGREKLSYFSNLSKSLLNTEWHFCLQADEILHENCFDTVRNVIELDAEGFWATRINMWGDRKHCLNVPDERKPVGTVIARLAKIQYDSIDDAQNINVDAHWEYLNQIRIYHVGFIRNKFLHTEKIRHMLVDVFEMGENDKKVDDMNGVFDPWVHFSKKDVIPIEEELPKFVKEWAAERDRINDFKI